MNIIIDTNILMAALIRDSLTRKILLKADNCQFYAPQYIKEEIESHKELILEKSSISRTEFATIYSELFANIRVVLFEESVLYADQATSILKNIDKNDIPFLATALTITNAIIWSEDKHFQRQRVVTSYTTKELLRILTFKQ